MKTYELNGKTYHLYYSIGRLEQIEKATGRSAMEMVVALGSMRTPTISEGKNYFAYGLLDEGGVYAPIKAALDFAEKQIETSGYVDIMMQVCEQLQEDCGFLFQGV